MTFKEFFGKIFGNVDDFLRETVAGLMSHYITTTIEGEGENKKVTRKLDVEAIRRDAPYFVMRYADEAAYNGLKIDLDPGLRLNLEEKMGDLPHPPGAVGPPPPPPLVGNHQRADIILTIVNMLVPENMGMLSRAECRRRALERLRQLAQIDDDQDWLRAAVADKLMKANELDYPLASLPGQIQQRLRQFVQNFMQAVTDGNQWLDGLEQRQNNARNLANQARLGNRIRQHPWWAAAIALVLLVAFAVVAWFYGVPAAVTAVVLTFYATGYLWGFRLPGVN